MMKFFLIHRKAKILTFNLNMLMELQDVNISILTAAGKVHKFIYIDIIGFIAFQEQRENLIKCRVHTNKRTISSQGYQSPASVTSLMTMLTET